MKTFKPRLVSVTDRNGDHLTPAPLLRESIGLDARAAIARRAMAEPILPRLPPPIVDPPGSRAPIILMALALAFAGGVLFGWAIHG